MCTGEDDGSCACAQKQWGKDDGSCACAQEQCWQTIGAAHVHTSGAGDCDLTVAEEAL